MLPDLETPDEDLTEDTVDEIDEDELDDFADLEDEDEELEDDVDGDGEEEADEADDESEDTARSDQALFDDFEVFRALGHDITPGHDQLHHYWVRGKGAALWKTWTELVAHLTRHVGLRKAEIYASRWFIERYGFAAGSDKNRLMHGKPPRGHLVGPG